MSSAAVDLELLLAGWQSCCNNHWVWTLTPVASGIHMHDPFKYHDIIILSLCSRSFCTYF